MSVSQVRKVIFIFKLSVIVALLFVIIYVLSFKDALGSDFVSFMTGALVVRQGDGELLYDVPTQYNYQKIVIEPQREATVLPFRHIPLFALLFIPFTFLPLLFAYKLFAIVNLGALLFFCFLTTRTFKKFNFDTVWPYLVFVFYPTLGSIFVGQISILLILLLLLIYRYSRKQNSFTSGILSGLLFLKIQYILFIPFIFVLSKTKKMYLKGLFLSTTIIFLLSILIFGPNFFYNYPSFLIKTENPIFGSRTQDMVTFYATLARIKPFSINQASFLILINMVFYALSLFLFYRILKRLNFGEAFVFGLVSTLVFSVHAIDYDLSLLIIPILILGEMFYLKRKDYRYISLVFLYILLHALAILAKEYLISPVLLFSSVLLYPRFGFFLNKNTNQIK